MHSPSITHIVITFPTLSIAIAHPAILLIVIAHPIILLITKVYPAILLIAITYPVRWKTLHSAWSTFFYIVYGNFEMKKQAIGKHIYFK